jgi:hypothetical protein
MKDRFLSHLPDRNIVRKVFAAIIALVVWFLIIVYFFTESAVFAQSTTQTSSPTGTGTSTVLATSTAVMVTITSQTTQDSGVIQGPTATLVPFPTITLLFPTTTGQTQLIYADRGSIPSLQKGEESLWRQFFSSIWLFVLIMIIWSMLVLWFVIVQWRS